MVDLESMIYAQKITWAKKLFKEGDRKWVNIPAAYFSPVDIKDFMMSNYREEYLPPTLPAFYRQCLIALLVIKTDKFADCADEALMQPLWFNKYIQFNNMIPYYNHWYVQGIRLVRDLYNSKGKLLSLQELVEKYGIRISNYLEIHSLINAIPVSWRKLIGKNNTNKSQLTYDEYTVYVKLKNKTRDILYSYNKDFYWALIDTKAKPAVPAVTKWRGLFGIEPDELKLYYQIPFNSIRHTKMQCMQYKILHDIYTCNLKLYHWKIKSNNLCQYCKEVDNVLHHFYFCYELQLFWNSFQNWWSEICKKCIFIYPLTPKQIILGLTEKLCHKPQLNYIVLLAKWYIFRAKYLEKECFFIEFLTDLKNNLNIERVIFSKNDKYIKYVEMWQDIYNSL
ncbi:MAG: hypothetical protein N2B06_05145 [Clostridium sp.]